MGKVVPQFKAESFFLIRTPRMPLDAFNAWNRQPELADEAIKQWFVSDLAQEALFHASSALLERSHKAIKKGCLGSDKKLLNTLSKYFVRMSTRCTPFGLFSGIQMGAVADTTQLVPGQVNLDKRRTRLDYHYLENLREQVAAEISLRNKQYIRVNTTVIKNDYHYRFIETYSENNNRCYRLSNVERDEYIDYLVECCQQSICFEKLVIQFCQHYLAAEKNAVIDFINQAIASGLLLVDLGIVVTGDKILATFVEDLKKNGTDKLAHDLVMIAQQLEDIDNANMAKSKLHDYVGIKQALHNINSAPKATALLQVDTLRHFEEATISQEQIDKLSIDLSLLNRLSSNNNEHYQQFIERFQKRYEMQMVPLLEALDEENGIQISLDANYDAPLLQTLGLQARHFASKQQHQAQRDNYLNQALITSEPQQEEIRLDREKLAKLASCDHFLPKSFAVLGSLIKNKNQDVSLLFNGCYGASAAKLIGRFCHLDEALKEKVKAHLRQEEAEQPEKIFAEVVHLPEGRSGNVIARPHLRDYEITFLSKSSLPDSRQISVSDLYLKVISGRVILYSKRLQKEIIPRLSSAHNFTARSLPIYRFLCMLQMQNQALPSFKLPEAVSKRNYIPRIRLGSLILSLRQWRIARNDFVQLAQYADHQHDYKSQVSALQERYHLPQQVTYTQGDNTLTIDLHNAMALGILLSETQGYQYITIKESLFHRFESLSASQDAVYANEVIIPFLKNSESQQQSSKLSSEKKEEIKNCLAQAGGKIQRRHFVPGSPWLSLKIYGGNSATENCLVNTVYPALKQFKCDDQLDYWFFIRYADPEPHLRLRIKGCPTVLLSTVLPFLSDKLASLIDNQIIHDFTIATYQQEIERYGGHDAIGSIERIFYANSLFTCAALEVIMQTDEGMRWRLAALGMNTILDAFKLKTQERLSLVDSMRQAFAREFIDSNSVRKRLGKKYRDYAKILRVDLANEQFTSNPFTAITQDLRSHLFEPVRELQALAKAKQLLIPLDRILPSILHMHYNRIFKSYNRQQEFVMHDFMRRHYVNIVKSPE